MGQFLGWVEEREGRRFDGYHDLWRWSVDDLAGFWSAVWEYFDVTPVTPPTAVLPDRSMPGTRWFPDATINYAFHCLRHEGPAPAVVSYSQTREPVVWSWDELRDQVARAQAGLVRLGVGRGDVVAGYLPNITEAIVAFLATASLGAVWTSCAPEFGVGSVVERLAQVEPKVLITVDGYRYGGRIISREAEVAAVRDVHRGEISVAYLGCEVESFDPNGRPVRGEQGELVVTTPMPSMPVGFWGDDDGARYRAAYFGDFQGVWRHGDWVTITDNGGYVISGRSDATLNRGGVRSGTSEYYSVVESFPEVADSLVVHLEDDSDGGIGTLVLLVALRTGAVLDDDLRSRLTGALRRSLSPRHVPDRLHEIPAVPRTLSGKKLEVPVKRVLTGTPIDVAAATGTLANPEALEAIAALAPTLREAPCP